MYENPGGATAPLPPAADAHDSEGDGTQAHTRTVAHTHIHTRAQLRLEFVCSVFYEKPGGVFIR